jgi:hypothetical protein
MSKDVQATLDRDAAALITKVTSFSDYESARSSLSCSLYDTAWVSMITKHIDGRDRWLFPESFQYLLEHQQLDGSWEDGGSEADCILSTLAALLALLKHRDGTANGSPYLPSEMEYRIRKAVASLDQRLKDWDATNTDQVGFEILCPALFRLIGRYGIEVNFPGLRQLTVISEKKLKAFDPKLIYSRHQSTVIHSLEAFVDMIDFDKVTHHLSNGSLMNSPAATAAYLIYASQWNDEAEAYLKRATQYCAGCGNGALPCAYPTDVFEITWVD